MVVARCVLCVLFVYHCLMVVIWEPSKLPPSRLDKLEYDYIVVGGGSAGCVVASRLSEDPNVTVLLLEAGEMDTMMEIHVPLAYVDLQLSSVDWAEQTVPQKHACRGLEGRRARWPMGKVLGGSSSINAMIYVRGNREDFDRWQEMGAEGWSYEDVLPYFKKSEDFRGSGDEGFHETGGYIPDGKPSDPVPHAGCEKFRGGYERAGLRRGRQQREEPVGRQLPSVHHQRWQAVVSGTSLPPFSTQQQR